MLYEVITPATAIWALPAHYNRWYFGCAKLNLPIGFPARRSTPGKVCFCCSEKVPDYSRATREYLPSRKGNSTAFFLFRAGHP